MPFYSSSNARINFATNVLMMTAFIPPLGRTAFDLIFSNQKRRTSNQFMDYSDSRCDDSDDGAGTVTTSTATPDRSSMISTDFKGSFSASSVAGVGGVGASGGEGSSRKGQRKDKWRDMDATIEQVGKDDSRTE